MKLMPFGRFFFFLLAGKKITLVVKPVDNCRLCYNEHAKKKKKRCLETNT